MTHDGRFPLYFATRRRERIRAKEQARQKQHSGNLPISIRGRVCVPVCMAVEYPVHKPSLNISLYLLQHCWVSLSCSRRPKLSGRWSPFFSTVRVTLRCRFGRLGFPVRATTSPRSGAHQQHLYSFSALLQLLGCWFGAVGRRWRFRGL